MTAITLDNVCIIFGKKTDGSLNLPMRAKAVPISRRRPGMFSACIIALSR